MDPTETAPAETTPADTPVLASPETVTVTDHVVACDDGGGVLGHPRVFLEMGHEGHVTCPYCGRRFVLASGEGATPGAAAES